MRLPLRRRSLLDGFTGQPEGKLPSEPWGGCGRRCHDIELVDGRVE
jgi:hypothetical protein